MKTTAIEKRLDRLQKRKYTLRQRINRIETETRIKVREVERKGEVRANRLHTDIHHLDNQIAFLTEKLGYMR